MTDFSLQRKNMVESQVRPSDVTDRRIIRAMSHVPREQFVGQGQRSIAYMDEAVPLSTAAGGRRAMLSPRLLAKMIQALELGDRDIVLEIGTATGYNAAVLARIAQTVVALEQDADFAGRAGQYLTALGIDNVAVVQGPHIDGYAQEGPYDAILISGAVPDVSPELLDQLKDGGRLVAVSTSTTMGRATLWRRLGANFDGRELFDAHATLLPGFERKAEFMF